MTWYAMAPSVMATRASALTFISATGQSYMDGMRFVQFYFGMPVALSIVSSRQYRSSTAQGLAPARDETTTTP